MAQYNLENLPVEWTSSPAGNFYIDGKSYCSISILDREVIEIKSSSDYLYDYKIQFLKRCFEYFNKVANPEEWLSRVGILDTFIDPFPNIGQKIIFSLSQATVESLPDNDHSVASSKAIYGIEDYFKKITHVGEKFIKYQSELLKDIFDKKTLGYEGLDFTMESQNLQLFNENIQKLFDINNIDISKYEAIQFEFDEPGNLIGINLDGIHGVAKLLISFSFFASQSPQNRFQTINLVRDLDNLYRLCRGTSSTYRDVIDGNYVVAKPIINNPQSPIHRTDPDSDSYGISNTDVTNKLASSTEVSKRFVKEFQNIATQSLYSTPCMTADQKSKIDAELESSRSKNLNFAKEIERSIGDSFVNSLPDVLVQIGNKKGKDAMDALGVHVLNRLGVCGLGDIIAMAANTATSYLNPEEYTSALTDCALEKLKNKDLESFALSLEKFNRGPQILERYRSIIGHPDLLPPWKTNGYRPPNSFYDGSFSDSFSVSLGKDQEYDIDFLFSSYKDSIRLEIQPENILEALTSSFPDEMGWISFFIDSTEILLSKCASPRDLSARINGNICNSKRFSLPEMFSANIGSTGIGSPSQIANQLVEELKNLIINLVVKTITSSMGQLMQIVSAGVSFDANYFKRGDYIPDLFQNEDYIYDALCDSASNKRRDRQEVGAATRQMLIKSNSKKDMPDISPDAMDRFLAAISVSLGEYEKIKLFRGIAGPVTYDKVLYLASQNGLGEYLANYSDVEQFFLELGKRLSVSDLEKKYFDKIYNFEPSPSFCLVDSEMLDRAYLQNKAGITQDQVDAMKKKLKDIQKNKICFAADAIGNPDGPILGEIGKMLKDTNNPIYQPLREKEVNYFIDSISAMLKSITSAYSSDLYAPGGVFDISMSYVSDDSDDNKKIVGYNDAKFGQLMGLSSILTPYEVFTDYEEWGTYEDFKESEIPLQLSQLTRETQFKNIPENDINSILSNFNATTLGTVIKSYFQQIRNNMTSGTLTLSQWEKTYNRLQKEKNVARLLGNISDFKDILKDTYMSVEDFDISPLNLAPLNLLPSKGALLQKYVSISLLIRIMYTEYIFKSLRVFKGYEINTLPQKTGFMQFLKDQPKDPFSDNKIRDNMVQILFQLPYQDNRASELEGLALELNKGIQEWLAGNIEDFYSSYEKQIDEAVSLFIEIVLSDYGQQNVEALFGPDTAKKIRSIAEIVVGEPVYIHYLGSIPETSSVQIRAEKFVDVGIPIDEDLPSGVISLRDLESSITSSMVDQEIDKFWPSGWRPGVRLVAIYPLDSFVEPASISSISSTTADGSSVVILPVSTYMGEAGRYSKMTSTALSALDDGDALLSSLIDSPQFKKYFYPSMNIEQILSFYTNYYINEVNERIPDSNPDGFFGQTKKMLLEL